MIKNSKNKREVMVNLPPMKCLDIESGSCRYLICDNKPDGKFFRCFMYKRKLPLPEGITLYSDFAQTAYVRGRGKVIGEFICDRVTRYKVSSGCVTEDLDSMLRAANVTEKRFFEIYPNDGDIAYFWHISFPKFYDAPRNTFEYGNRCEDGDCLGCSHNITERVDDSLIYRCENMGYVPYDAPPKVWGYAEEIRRGEIE